MEYQDFALHHKKNDVYAEIKKVGYARAFEVFNKITSGKLEIMLHDWIEGCTSELQLHQYLDELRED